MQARTLPEADIITCPFCKREHFVTPTTLQGCCPCGAIFTPSRDTEAHWQPPPSPEPPSVASAPGPPLTPEPGQQPGAAGLPYRDAIEAARSHVYLVLSATLPSDDRRNVEHLVEALTLLGGKPPVNALEMLEGAKL